MEHARIIGKPYEPVGSNVDTLVDTEQFKQELAKAIEKRLASGEEGVERTTLACINFLHDTHHIETTETTKEKIRARLNEFDAISNNEVAVTPTDQADAVMTFLASIVRENKYTQAANQDTHTQTPLGQKTNTAA